MTTDTDRTEGIEYWRSAAADDDDIVFNDGIDAALGDEWTPLVELDEYTDARGGVVHLAGASYRADAVEEACQAALDGRPMRIYAVATPIPEDPHAVSIYGEPHAMDDAPSTLLGYLPRPVARLVHDDIEPDDIHVLPLVYFPDHVGGHRWPGMRLVVVRRSEELSWEFHPEAIKDLQRRASSHRGLSGIDITLPGTTPFESVFGERPEVILRRAATQISGGAVMTLYDMQPEESDENWEPPLGISFPDVEAVVQDYSTQQLAAAAGAWGIHPTQLANDLLVEVRMSSLIDDEFEDRYRTLADHTAERWRACVAHRLLELAE